MYHSSIELCPARGGLARRAPPLQRCARACCESVRPRDATDAVDAAAAAAADDDDDDDDDHRRDDGHNDDGDDDADDDDESHS